MYSIYHLWLNLVQVAEYQNCRVLLVDKKISTARDMVGILEAAIRGGFPLLIMAEDIEQALPVPWLSNLCCGNIVRVFSSCKWGKLASQEATERSVFNKAPALHTLQMSLTLSRYCVFFSWLYQLRQ